MKSRGGCHPGSNPTAVATCYPRSYTTILALALRENVEVEPTPQRRSKPATPLPMCVLGHALTLRLLYDKKLHINVPSLSNVASDSCYAWIEWFGNPWKVESDFPAPSCRGLLVRIDRHPSPGCNSGKTWDIKQMGKATIIAVKVVPLYEGGGSRVESLLNDSLLILGFLVVVLAPMALALAENGPAGTGWKLLTFLCCASAAWFFIFPSNLLIALGAWVLAWACAMALRMSLRRRA